MRMRKRSSATSILCCVSLVSIRTPGSVVGLGTGQAATAFLHALGERVRSGFNMLGIPTSRASAELARQLQIPLTSFEDAGALDLCVDGADEVDPGDERRHEPHEEDQGEKEHAGDVEDARRMAHNPETNRARRALVLFAGSRSATSLTLPISTPPMPSRVASTAASGNVLSCVAVALATTGTTIAAARILILGTVAR